MNKKISKELIKIFRSKFKFKSLHLHEPDLDKNTINYLKNCIDNNSVSSVGKFALIPIPLFVLMGDLLMRTGLAARVVEAVDLWIGRIPGRLSLSSVGGGTVFGALSGASMASVAMLGSTLVPEMTKRGYKSSMSVGSILAGGGLAVLIPPSALGVLLGAVAKVSISKLLIGNPITLENFSSSRSITFLSSFNLPTIENLLASPPHISKIIHIPNSSPI